MAPRDSQDLMAFPFFSLAKSRRTAPIDFRAGGVTIRVEGTQEHGIATIWDADVLIWAASQIVEARDAGLRPSRLMQATPYEILRFIGRGTSLRDYQRLKAAWIACNRPRWPRPSARPPGGAAPLLVDQRVEGTGRCQRHAAGHRADPAGLVLCGRARRRPGADHRPGVFPAHGRHRALAVPPGAQARRAAAGRLAIRLPAPAPSGSATRFYDFAYDLRALVARQSLPGYVLGIERMPDNGAELLTFRPVPFTARG
jgi:plasmid replication initiation protein